MFDISSAFPNCAVTVRWQIDKFVQQMLAVLEATMVRHVAGHPLVREHPLRDEEGNVRARVVRQQVQAPDAVVPCIVVVGIHLRSNLTGMYF